MTKSLRHSLATDEENPAAVSVAVYKSKPLLEAVLDGERKFPLSLEAFQEFLEQEKAGELGHFYMDAKSYEKLAAALNRDEAVPLAKTIAKK